MRGADRRRPVAGVVPRGARLAALLLLMLQHPACASDLAREEGRYRHRLGFTLADPAAGPGSSWRPFGVEGAALAYRGPDRATMTWLVSCDRPLAAPEVLSRQLLIGLRGRAVLAQGPVAVGGGAGWTQRVSASEGGSRVRMKTVTRVSGACVLDWLLIAPGALEPYEPAFDRWWGSFRDAETVAGAEP